MTATNTEHLNRFYVTDCETKEIEIRAWSPRAAGDEYVEDGHWGNAPRLKTFFVDVKVVDADEADAARAEADENYHDDCGWEDHTIKVEPISPDCVTDEGGGAVLDHEWIDKERRADVVVETCEHCKCEMVTRLRDNDHCGRTVVTVEYVEGDC